MKETTQKDVDEAKKNFKRSFIFLGLALTLWPFGLFFGPLVSLLIFSLLALLWGVSAYISFMHYLSAKNRAG